MKFWIIHAQEPLPQPSHMAARRLWRTNTIAEMLADRGHQVLRWRSGFSHYEKRYLAQGSPRERFEGYEFQFLEGPPYRRNIGYRRILHHRAVACDFARLVSTTGHAPDLIHIGNVPLELCREAAKFSAAKRIPIIIDIRDLWPDLFLDLIPDSLGAFRPLMKLFLRSSYRDAAFAMSHATAITGITEPFVEWGLRLAGRKRRETDRVFHMSYPEPAEPGSHGDASPLTDKLGLERSSFIICYFGNIGYQSDFDTLLEAARLLGDCAAAKLVICGDGPKLESLRKKAAGLANVVLPGWLEADEIQQLMRIAAVGLIPFKERDNYVLNMPNKFSEYLSGGLAIACGVKGEMARLVEAHACGFVYPTGDAATLARRLRELVASPDMVATLKESSRALFKASFDCTVVYGQLCDYLEMMAAGAAPKGERGPEIRSNLAAGA